MMTEYADAGVDYAKIDPFKQAMVKMAQGTVLFPNARGVRVLDKLMHAHGAVYEYKGLLFCQTTEGLGNKNWIAEWMYANAGTGQTYYQGIGIDTALMAVNDLIAQGAMPIIYTDEVAAGDSEWFTDEKRARDLAAGFREVCQLVGMALPAGESPALRYLVNAAAPVKSCPSLSGCVTGIINPNERLVTGEKLQSGLVILGATSSGWHANGASLIIKRAMDLPDKFLTKLPNGNTLGDEALIPTRSYVALIEALFEAGVDIHALVPGTGSGVSKVAFDKRPFTYRIHTWVKEIPVIMQFMREIGVSLEDCLTTFNCGIGYYIFVTKDDVAQAIEAGTDAGYELIEIGRVEKGERKVIFEPEDITLSPPGE